MRSISIVLAMVASAALTPPAYAVERGDMLIKLRGTYGLRSQSDDVSFKLRDDSNVTAKADNAIGAELSLTYFLTDHVATELAIGGAPYDIKDGGSATLVSTGLIMPTATLQYYPITSGRIRPYMGAGAAYVHFYGEKAGAILTNQNQLPLLTYSASLDSAIAPVAQLGFDISLDDKTYLNLDAKYIWAKSDLTVTQGANYQTRRQDMKSAVFGIGAGFRF